VYLTPPHGGAAQHTQYSLSLSLKQCFLFMYYYSNDLHSANMEINVHFLKYTHSLKVLFLLEYFMPPSTSTLTKGNSVRFTPRGLYLFDRYSFLF